MKIRAVVVVRFLTLLLLVYCGKGYCLEPSQLEGAWQVKSETEDPEGFVISTDYTTIFYRDGSFYQTGTSLIRDGEDDTRVVTATGPEIGHWKLEDDLLTMDYEEVRLDYFSSVLPDLDRKAFETMIREGLEEDDMLKLEKTEKTQLVFREEKEGMIFHFIRIEDSPIASQKGGAFIEPAASFTIEELGGDPTQREGVKEDPRGAAIREVSRAILTSDGFKASPSLPTFAQRKGLGGKMRPREEILARLLAMQAVVNWVVIDEENLSSEEIESFLERHDLKAHLTEEERAILALDRSEAQKEHAGSIGWSMENMWALAWVLGFEHAPDIDQGQVGEALLTELWDFLEPAWDEQTDLDQLFELREAAEVVQAEDLFYCAHNAVRSAQLGRKTVPEGYHPIILGGVVHEKRHALTWVLSPGVTWDETDLST